jgi:predicted  nucleic acid-binding Zn-ribbon protein
MPKKSKTDITLEEFRRRKYKLMQEIDDINSGKRLESLSKELDDIKKRNPINSQSHIMTLNPKSMTVY